MMMEKAISIQTLQRLPLYLQYLRALSADKGKNVSAKMLGNALGFGEIQVRKDLSSVSDGGKPKLGYCTKELIRDIEVFLGYDNVNDAVLVGAGKLGKALLSYQGFRDYGLNIVAGFDSNSEVCGTDESGKQILHLSRMEDLCRRMKIELGIITVPANEAQSVCDTLVKSGIRAVWNFAPVHLDAPKDVIIKNENIAASLAVLSKNLAQKENLAQQI
ncbi:MAG: redox-sensing transcriptional repressor Rex [Oscillospiraceae bacterium]|nr:redox-sensing transcriptional repressor Rex [Oscillospiraceae bacterium]